MWIMLTQPPAGGVPPAQCGTAPITHTAAEQLVRAARRSVGEDATKLDVMQRVGHVLDDAANDVDTSLWAAQMRVACFQVLFAR